MIVDSLKANILKGKKGQNIGLSTGLDKLDALTYGTNRGWMTVWAGDTGSGKSSLVLFATIYYPFKQYLESGKKLDIHFLIFSWELSAEVVFTKLLSIYLWDHYHQEISYEQILSLVTPITDEQYKYVLDAFSWLAELEEHCEIIDRAVTALHMYGICKEWAKKYGEFKEVGKIGEYTKTEYIPNNPEQFLIVNVDHLKLIKTSKDHTSKQEMDEASEYLITLRNKCNFTINVVQQLNRNFKSVERRQEVPNRSGLQLNDLSDSGGPSQAAELVIGIWNPFRERQKKCEDYNIVQLLDNIRILHILKHRFGLADRVVGVNFFGSAGIWRSLPKPDQISDWEPYTHL